VVSRRKRSNSSVGNKLNNLNDRVAQKQKDQQVTGTQTNAVTNDSIAPNAVNSESIADRAITSRQIGTGEVTSENLGALTEIVAGGSLTIDAGLDGHLRLDGTSYNLPYEGLNSGAGLYTMAFDPADNAIKILDATPTAHDGLRFDTTYTGGSTATGMLSWSDDDETIEMMLNSGVTLEVGQEHLLRVKNASASVAIPKFTAVGWSNPTAGILIVSPATGTGARDFIYSLIGITTQEIPADGYGFITQFGIIDGIKTDNVGWSMGSQIYLDPATTTGQLTATAPSAPSHRTPVCRVIKVDAADGKVLVRLDRGTRVGDIQDATITSALEGQTLLYNSSGVWVNSASPSQNFFINGAFDMWQRGTLLTGDANGQYGPDRWRITASSGGGSAGVSQQTDVPSGQILPYSALLTLSGTTTSGQVQQRIESSYAHQLAGQTVTFSIWARRGIDVGSATSTLTWSTAYPSGTDSWGSSTADQSGTFSASFTSTTWTRYSATFTVNALATRGYSIAIKRTLSAAQTATYTYLAGAQLEIGSIATPFRRNSPNIQAELAACQRYYQRIVAKQAYSLFASGVYNSTTAFYMPIHLPVELRTTPAVSYSGAFRTLTDTTETVSSIAIYTYSSTNPVSLAGVSSSSSDGNAAVLGANNDAAAYIEFDAEL